MRPSLIAAAALLAASCGGGDDDASERVDQADAATAAADATADAGQAAENAADVAVADGDEDGGDETGSGTNVASVTVGDQTYDFEWQADAIQRCDTDFFGAFWALSAPGAGDPSFEATFWPADAADPTQVSKIEVDAGDETNHFTADPEETGGTTVENWPARVDSFDIDGNTVTGSATFVGEYTFGEEPETIAGTFEITCAG